MKNAKTFVLALSALALAAMAAPRPQEPTPAPVDIVDTAAKTDGLKTFSSLVAKAGLVEALKKPGPFTVFAPTDAAFEKIPKETLDRLTADPEALKKVLTYHVVKGATLSTDLKDGAEMETVEGEPIKVTLVPGVPATDNESARPPSVALNGKRASIVKPDQKASNGVIHQIDNVLIPPLIAPPASPTPPSRRR